MRLGQPSEPKEDPESDAALPDIEAAVVRLQSDGFPRPLPRHAQLSQAELLDAVATKRACCMGWAIATVFLAFLLGCSIGMQSYLTWGFPTSARQIYDSVPVSN